jgi:hypothetical protein
VTRPGIANDPVGAEIGPDPEKPSTSHHGWRRPLIGFLIVLASLTLVAPVGVAIASRLKFGTVSFWAAPVWVDYCGRRYNREGTQSGSPALFQSTNSDPGAKWEQVDSTFTGRPIYGVISPPTPGQQSCTVILFMPASNGRWTAYQLSGGP